MKALRLLLAVLGWSAFGQDINLTNRLVTFTNLQGQAFSAVELVRGDLDGVIWRKESSGGRVCYTNLDPLLLERWGIPSNRVEIARQRAEHKALTSAQSRAWALRRAQVEAAARAKAEAQEAELAPLRARAAQMQADAQAIASLAGQIAAAKTDLRRKEAMVNDYNSANLYNDAAPYLFIQEGARVSVEEAEERLAKMKADFLSKYRESAH